jgi:hypothetical protein
MPVSNKNKRPCFLSSGPFEHKVGTKDINTPVESEITKVTAEKRTVDQNQENEIQPSSMNII